MTLLFLVLFTMGHSVLAFSTEGKKVSVYTTASNTEHRIAFTAEKSFESSEQCLESEVAVFVNPNKTFQTFLGIGGAITDASAEVFAQLPASKQNELVKAYYSIEDLAVRRRICEIMRALAADVSVTPESEQVALAPPPTGVQKNDEAERES